MRKIIQERRRFLKHMEMEKQAMKKYLEEKERCEMEKKVEERNARRECERSRSKKRMTRAQTKNQSKY